MTEKEVSMPETKIIRTDPKGIDFRSGQAGFSHPQWHSYYAGG
jgi:hypothetical protein